MKRFILAATIAAATAWALPQAAHAEPPAPTVPGAIAVPDGNKLFLVAHATGVQIYSCTPTGWSFVAPEAELRGDNGERIGAHFGGPTWQALDGSSVIGRRVDGATVDPGAIDWLLLATRSTSSGPDGDRLAGTTFIQRTATTGGLAPAGGCSVGDEARVPYTADYYFWKAKRG